MRIRYKKWARPELEASPFYVDNPENERGIWRELFKSPTNPLYLELGCGKGNFIANLASTHKNINYIAIDLVDAMLGLAKRNVEEVYKERNLETDRIYINFCNPWPRGKHHKKRLTHTRQLEKYKEFLKPGGELYFKTDDDNLFMDSLKYFEEAGFEIVKKTFDLHSEIDFWENIETEHEKMFSEQGIKIKALIVK